MAFVIIRLAISFAMLFLVLVLISRLRDWFND